MEENKFLLRCTLVILVSTYLFSATSYACTIVSGVDDRGHVWNANNEDGPFGVSNFINVFPKREDRKYGYYTLCYISPMFGNGGKIQGGMNEAGLTFDFAAIEPVDQSALQGKQPFPQGDEAILPYLLANMGSTAEVVKFFETYWFENGFLTAQMHVADKNGVFANISPSGIQVVDNGESLVTTNFDICGKEDSSSCWRYPIATSLLSAQGASLSTMMSLCKNTAQKTGGTMYSNVQNLTTGNIWFLSKHDPDVVVNTNIKDLLSQGQRSYTFSDLESIVSEEETETLDEPTPITLDGAVIDQFAGTYKNWYIGEMEISPRKDAIHLAAQFAPSETLYAKSENSFFIPDANIVIEFTVDKKEKKKTLHFFENGNWSFSAWSEID